MKLIRLLKRITAIITLYTIQTKLRVALVVTCCVALAVQHARHSTYDFFLYRNAWAY